MARNGAQPDEPFNNTKVITYREDKDKLPMGCIRAECHVTVTLSATMENQELQGLSATSVDMIGEYNDHGN